MWESLFVMWEYSAAFLLLYLAVVSLVGSIVGLIIGIRWNSQKLLRLTAGLGSGSAFVLLIVIVVSIIIGA